MLILHTDGHLDININFQFSKDKICKFKYPNVKDETYVFTQCNSITSQTNKTNKIIDYDDI